MSLPDDLRRAVLDVIAGFLTGSKDASWTREQDDQGKPVWRLARSVRGVPGSGPPEQFLRIWRVDSPDNEDEALQIHITGYEAPARLLLQLAEELYHRFEVLTQAAPGGSFPKTGNPSKRAGKRRSRGAPPTRRKTTEEPPAGRRAVRWAFRYAGARDRSRRILLWRKLAYYLKCYLDHTESRAVQSSPRRRGRCA